MGGPVGGGPSKQERYYLGLYIRACKFWGNSHIPNRASPQYTSNMPQHDVGIFCLAYIWEAPSFSLSSLSMEDGSQASGFLQEGRLFWLF